MNPRQRLFAILNGKPTDHIPVWLLFPYHPASYYADVRSQPSYRAVFEASLKHAITLNRRNPGVPLFSPEVKTWGETSREGEERVERSIIEYKGKRLVAETRHQKSNTAVKKLLCTDADLEFYCSLPVNTSPGLIQAQMDAQMPQYLRETAEFPIDCGAMMLDLGEPIGHLYHASNLESYAIWSLTHADQIVDFLDRVMVHQRLVYNYCLARDLADVYFLVGSELASPPLLSRKTFHRWAVPYASELIEMIHRCNKKVIQHYHGAIKQILPDFIAMQPDALHTIEAPPTGNCTFSEAFNVVGDRMALIGNIQYDQLRALSAVEMHGAVMAVLDECRGKRLILSPSAGPYEPTITRRMAENYLVFMQTAWEYQMA